MEHYIITLISLNSFSFRFTFLIPRMRLLQTDSRDVPDRLFTKRTQKIEICVTIQVYLLS